MNALLIAVGFIIFSIITFALLAAASLADESIDKLINRK